MTLKSWILLGVALVVMPNVRVIGQITQKDGLSMVITDDLRVHVGVTTKDEGNKLVFFDLRSGKEIILTKSAIRDIKTPIEDNQAARLIGIEELVAYKLGKALGDTNRTVAVVNFTKASVESAQAKSLREKITNGLANRGFRLVERARLDAVLREHTIQKSADFADDEKLQLGKLLGASVVFTGEMTIEQPGMAQASLRAIDVTTGLVLASILLSVEVPRDSSEPAPSTSLTDAKWTDLLKLEGRPVVRVASGEKETTLHSNLPWFGQAIPWAGSKGGWAYKDGNLHGFMPDSKGRNKGEYTISHAEIMAQDFEIRLVYRVVGAGSLTVGCRTYDRKSYQAVFSESNVEMYRINWVSNPGYQRLGMQGERVITQESGGREYPRVVGRFETKDMFSTKTQWQEAIITLKGNRLSIMINGKPACELQDLNRLKQFNGFGGLELMVTARGKAGETQVEIRELQSR